MRGCLDWGVRGEKGSDSRVMAVELGLKGEQGWVLRGGRKDQVAQERGERVPVSQGPIQ